MQSKSVKKNSDTNSIPTIKCQLIVNFVTKNKTWNLKIPISQFYQWYPWTSCRQYHWNALRKYSRDNWCLKWLWISKCHNRHELLHHILVAVVSNHFKCIKNLALTLYQEVLLYGGYPILFELNKRQGAIL